MNIKDKLINIVKQAAELMTSANFEVTQKEGFANIVTSTDIAVQDFLCKQLAELLPGSGFLCEEDDMNDTSHEYTWIIDPIDGTANFSRGIDQCAICVGLAATNKLVNSATNFRSEDNGTDANNLSTKSSNSSTIVLSIVYIPRTKELFYAEKGKGAYLNGKQIHVSERPFSDAILCTALPVYHKEYAELCSNIILKAFTQCNDIRRFGACAPELCYLAMGRCEVYFEYLLSPWDFAAASLIVTEAGGVITGLDGTIPSCTKPSGIVAANTRDNLNRMLEIIKSK